MGVKAVAEGSVPSPENFLPESLFIRMVVLALLVCLCGRSRLEECLCILVRDGEVYTLFFSFQGFVCRLGGVRVWPEVFHRAWP